MCATRTPPFRALLDCGEKRERERPEHSLMRDLFIMPVEATPSRDAPLLLLLLPYKDQSHFSLLMAKDKAERKTRELFEK